MTKTTPTALALMLAALVAALLLATPARAAGPCDPPVTNKVACENSKPGTPRSDWEVNNVGDSTIQGYATQMSVVPGETIAFKIKTPAASYHIDILRLGYYGGLGARKVEPNLLPSATLPQTQPSCPAQSSTGLIDCGNWAVSASWTVPSDAVSGMYIAHLVRNDNGRDSQIPFVVRDDSSHSDILVTTSDASWVAYNAYGGNSLYTCTVSCPAGSPGGYKAAYAASYNRPFDGSIYVDGGHSYLWNTEYQMIRWLERNGYDVSYTSDVDIDRTAAQLSQHKAFVASGHDEYWSGAMRANVTSARDAGVSLAFFTGNEIFWKTRYAASNDGTNTPRRTIVSYKDTHFSSPQDPVAWTGTWRDPRFSPPGDGGRPENSLTGQNFLINRGSADITVPSTFSGLRFWRNTAVASLQPGQTLTLAPTNNTLGYEWDVDVDNGSRPDGLFRLSSTTVSGLEQFVDFGTTVTQGATATHNLTLYRTKSGALVFGAGTVQWAWGLDTTNAWANDATIRDGAPTDPVMQQATLNLFADMGAQPATPAAGMVTSPASADTTAPSSTITAPAAGAKLADGRKITITGTAADSGGGTVSAVEVSTDNGSTWHPATGTTSWSFAWIAHGNPKATIRSRAIDDSGNIETPSAGIDVAVICPCSMFGDTTPASADSGDATSLELGVRFKADVDGLVSGVRFYKAAANTGTHVGTLWSSSGTALASATFTGETASGWQEVRFSTPIRITAGTTYVVSYLAPNGHYAVSSGAFYTPPPVGDRLPESPPLHALGANGQGTGGGNGVYAYAATSTFPTSSFGAANYYVDVLFGPPAPPEPVTGVTATAGAGAATVSWTAATGGAPVTSYKVTPYTGTTAQPSRTVTGAPPAATTQVSGLTPGEAYTFTVTAVNDIGSSAESAPSNTVTPTALTVPTAPTGITATTANRALLVNWNAPADDGGRSIIDYTVTPYTGTTAGTPVTVTAPATSTRIGGLVNGTQYTFRVSARNSVGQSPDSAASAPVAPQAMLLDSGTPAAPDSGDATAAELGVKFRSTQDGEVAGIRFYKSTANTGTHVGTLWTAGGVKLASATFAGETGSGWQQVTFAKPVAITAGTTYVASYYAPKGHYTATSGAFANQLDNPPLQALASSESPNGVYAYSSSTTFPANSYGAANYWVDVLVAPPSLPDPVTGVTATAGPGSATVSWTAASTGGNASSYKVTPYLGGTAQTAKTVTGAPPATSTTVSGLTAGASYTFTVQAINLTGSSAESAPSNAVTPTGASVPSAPSGVTGEAGFGAALVAWTPPVDDGGRAITGYNVTPYAGPIAGTPVQVGGSTTSTRVGGLQNGTAYTFKVRATNSAGDSLDSAASAPVTPQITVFEYTQPAIADSGDTTGVEVGMKFKADGPGAITGIRFYKAAANGGTHVGTLWATDGTKLASGTFTGETASGWQQLTFATPVNLIAGQTYVASYYAPKGHYSSTPAGLGTAVDTGPLHTIAAGVSANGVYSYGGSSGFPTSTWNATNYWVDVVYAPPTGPGVVTGVTATAGNGSAAISWTAPSSGSPPTSYAVTPQQGSTTLPAKTITGTPPATTTTISGLTPGSPYSFTVRASNSVGDGPVSDTSNVVTPTGASAPAAPASVRATAGPRSATVTWDEPFDGGSAITGYTVTPYSGATAGTPVTAGASSTSATITGLSSGTAYTFTVAATNAVGTGSASAASNAATPYLSILDTTTPAIVDAGDTSGVEVGVKFTSDVAGQVTGIRFYKSAANTGTHVGRLWTSTGTLLASATFTGESAGGWQQATFATPVSITAATTYVASYHAPNGHYSATGAAFANGLDNAPLHAVANTVSANGVYAYGLGGTFPINSWNATNYSVDVMFGGGA